LARHFLWGFNAEAAVTSERAAGDKHEGEQGEEQMDKEQVDEESREVGKEGKKRRAATLLEPREPSIRV
jgi:hypothetical protein